MIDGTHHFVGLTTAAEAKVSLMSPWMLIIMIVMIVLCSPWWFCMVTIVMLMVVVTILMHTEILADFNARQLSQQFLSQAIHAIRMWTYILKKNIHLCNVHRQIWCAIHGLCGYCSPNVVCFRSWFRYMHPVKAQSMCPVAPAETTNVVKPTKAMCLQGVYREWPSLRQKAWNVDHKRSAHTLLSRGFQAAPCPSWSHGQAGQPPDICKIFSGSPNLLAFPQLACINPFLLILNVPLILKTGIHLQFPKISVWPIWLLIDPL